MVGEFSAVPPLRMAINEGYIAHGNKSDSMTGPAREGWTMNMSVRQNVLGRANRFPPFPTLEGKSRNRPHLRPRRTLIRLLDSCQGPFSRRGLGRPKKANEIG